MASSGPSGLSAARASVVARYAIPADKSVRIYTGVPAPRRPAFSVEELTSGAGGTINLPLLREHLSTEGRMHPDAAVALIRMAKDTLALEPNLLETAAPVTIVGDLHGQFFDLLQILDSVGWPPERKYLFLGDYVDRGIYSTEVVLLLFALKVLFPEHVLLLRGNHESRAMTEYHNAKSETMYKYDARVYAELVESFDALPLCALVQGAGSLRFLCMHGGLSPGLDSLAAINAIHRFTEIPASGPLCDLCWSDPLPDETGEALSGTQRAKWLDTKYDYNSQRGCSYRYGPRAVREFLDKNSVTALIRAHEVQESGFKAHTFLEPGREYPMVTTVFSAPNYCEAYNNKAAVLHLAPSGPFSFQSFDSVGHPMTLPDCLNALTWSLPYVLEKVTQFFASTLKLIENDPDDDDDEPQPVEPPPADEPADNSDAEPVGLRSRSARVKTTKRPNIARRRSSSNVVNELILSRRASMGTLLRRTRELREKYDKMLPMGEDGAASDEAAGAAAAAADAGESRFERALKNDAMKELLRPMQRHYTM